MSALSQCTIVIPTHNRSQYLARCVRWFSEFNCPIVIADSSAEISCGGLESENVVHIHHPGGFEVYPRKLELAMSRVQTPFVAMCADDDFITREGLEASVSFLQAHDHYSFSQGYAYLYQKFDKRLVVWPMVYPYHNVESDDWVERIEQAKSTVYYGVNRTEVLREGIAFVVRQNWTGMGTGLATYFDTAITAYAARMGKFRRCEVPFALREYSSIVFGVGDRYVSLISRNLPDFYSNLIRLLCGGNADPEKYGRLLRFMAADYSAVISYDLSVAKSRKARFRRLPKWALSHAEHAFRIYSAARQYCSREYRPFLKVFSTPDYRRFKAFVVGSEKS